MTLFRALEAPESPSRKLCDTPAGRVRGLSIRLGRFDNALGGRSRGPRPKPTRFSHSIGQSRIFSDDPGDSSTKCQLSNGLAYSRSTGQVLNIVYLNKAAVTAGGFFPNGVNGTIVTSAAN